MKKETNDWIEAEIKLLETKKTRTQFEERQLYELKYYNNGSK